MTEIHHVINETLDGRAEKRVFTRSPTFVKGMPGPALAGLERFDACSLKPGYGAAVSRRAPLPAWTGVPDGLPRLRLRDQAGVRIARWICSSVRLASRFSGISMFASPSGSSSAKRSMPAVPYGIPSLSRGVYT